MIDMSRDLIPYQAAVASQNPCHCLKSNVIPGVTSDRMLRLARSAEFRQEPWARLAGLRQRGSASTVRSCASRPYSSIRSASARRPHSRSHQASPLSTTGSPAAAASRVELLGVGLPPRPPAQPDGQLAQRDRVTGGGRLPKGLLGVGLPPG